MAAAFGFNAESTWYTVKSSWLLKAKGAPRIADWIQDPDAVDQDDEPLYDDLNDAKFSSLQALITGDEAKEVRRLKRETKERQRRRDRAADDAQRGRNRPSRNRSISSDNLDRSDDST